MDAAVVPPVLRRKIWGRKLRRQSAGATGSYSIGDRQKAPSGACPRSSPVRGTACDWGQALGRAHAQTTKQSRFQSTVTPCLVPVPIGAPGVARGAGCQVPVPGPLCLSLVRSHRPRLGTGTSAGTSLGASAIATEDLGGEVPAAERRSYRELFDWGQAEGAYVHSTPMHTPHRTPRNTPRRNRLGAEGFAGAYARLAPVEAGTLGLSWPRRHGTFAPVRGANGRGRDRAGGRCRYSRRPDDELPNLAKDI